MLDGCFLRKGPTSTLFITVPQHVCHHKASDVPPKGIRCATTRHKMCHHKASGVPLRGIRCTSRHQVCYNKASGVPPQGIRCTTTRHRVCHNKASGVPPQGIRCATARHQMYHHKASNVPRILTYIRKLYLEKAIHDIKLFKFKSLLFLPICVFYIFVVTVYLHPSITNNIHNNS
jgi:hypothetical protein